MANKKAFFILTVFLIFSSVSFAQKSNGQKTITQQNMNFRYRFYLAANIQIFLGQKQKKAL